MQFNALGNDYANSTAMPNQNSSCTLKNIVSPQLGRIMKLTSIILLTACMYVSAKGITQTITLSENQAVFLKIIEAIERQSDYVFFYKAGILEHAKKVTINVENKPLREVLDLCFKEQPFFYFISGKNINIRLKQERKGDLPGIDVTGKITDNNGNPLSGANISIRGAKKGTISHADGTFTLDDVDENSILEVSYVGFETVIISLQGRRKLVINLKPKGSFLDETVVIAYGTTTKRLATGNVATIRAEEIEKQPVNNPLLSLQGRVPGVSITQTSGMPGSGVMVKIQGQNSLLNGSNPLYVVDGVPISTEIPSAGQSLAPYPNSGESYIRQTNTGRGSTLAFLNPSDIASIEILKDADATAIYGSRAANGAILITTKKGKLGKTSLNVDVQHGFGQVRNFMKLLNTRQYLEMRNEALKNDGIAASPDATASDPFIYAPDLSIWDTTRETNWQKELLGRTASFTHANASISGGTAAAQYLIGTNYHKEKTVFPGNFANERGSIHFNLNNNEATQKFHFQISSNYTADNNKLPGKDLTELALTIVPVAPRLYNTDGSLNWELDANGNSTFVNPLSSLLYRTYESKTTNLIANGTFGYEILPGLRASTSIGYTHLQSNDIQKNYLSAERPEYRSLPGVVRRVNYSDSKLKTWIIEPQLSYKRAFDKNKIDGLLGTSFQRTDRESSFLHGAGYNSDQLMESPNAAATLTAGRQVKSLYKYNAVFGRINYTFNDKYIFTATGRRDGSTRFGSNDKFQNFWSISAGWIFSKERFFENTTSVLSFGKVKGSYGTTGSDQIGDYRFLTLYNVVNPQVPYQNTTGLTPGDIPNPYLQWEETKKLNIGVDLGIFNDRVFITANYSRNRSSNQLIEYYLPLLTGRQTVLQNFPATIQNTNMEFTLTTQNIKWKEFSWATNINLTIPRNKLVSFPNIETTTYKNIYTVGQPVNTMKLFNYGEVDAASGVYSFVDSLGNKTFYPSFGTDKTVLFSDFQKIYGGIQNTIQYKGFQLDFLFQFVKRESISPEFAFNYTPGNFYEYASIGNQPESVMKRWQKVGDITDIQKFSAIYGSTDDAYFNLTLSNRNYTDASFIRLKNVSLSWDLPSKWIQKVRLQNCRLYAHGQNLFTFTNYKGLDPETPGLVSLPPLRVITFGLQLKL